MRYILNDTGYIDEVSFGAIIECKEKTCTEYTGEVPSGYESLCEWSDNANIRAYKIVDGNLVFDEEEDARLQEEYEELSNDYSRLEKKIGTWIDSKPIYRKVFEGNLPATTGWIEATFVTLPDVDVLVNIGGNFTGSDGRKMTLPYIESGYEIAVTYLKGKLEINQSTVEFINRPCCIILEYTKTTD